MTRRSSHARRPGRASGVPGRMRLHISVSALLVASCSATGEAPADTTITRSPPAVFTIDVSPGEGIPVMQAMRASLPLRLAPDLASPIVDVVGARVGERVPFDSTQFQTVAAGHMVVTDTLTLTGRNLGPVRHLSREQYYRSSRADTSITMPPNAQIEFLQHRAEGTCFVRLDGNVIDARRCPVLDTERVRIDREPVTRWWIGLRGQDDRFGWIVVSDTTIKSVRREF